MSSLLKVIESITNWLNDDVFPDIKLKQYADNELGYVKVSPVAFSMFMPNREMRENSEEIPCPCALVQLNDATDYLKTHTGTVNILLHLMIWNPGTHDSETTAENVISPDMKYSRDADGWKDAVIFADCISQKLKAASNINGHRILYENGIKKYPYKEENAIIDFYPRYFVEMEFSVENASATSPKPYQKYL